MRNRMLSSFLLVIFTILLFSSSIAASEVSSEKNDNLDRSVYANAHEHINELIHKYSQSGGNFENKHVAEIYKEDGFRKSLASYPVGPLTNNYTWHPGKGVEITGPVSGYKLKIPFADYIPLPKGAVLDEEKTYQIGFVYSGSNHPWLVSLADSAVWEAGQHPNVKIEVRDAEFKASKMAQIVQSWIAQEFDAIVMWPARKGPTAPIVDRAIDAGIPVVTVDRRSASNAVSTAIVGNFYANGLQQGLYLNAVTDGKGAMILNRKPLGSTADSIRTGAFLEAIGDKKYEIVGSYHTNSQRRLAFKTTLNALQAHDSLDIVFNTGGEEALGALRAAQSVGRADKLIILANDASKELLAEVRKGNIDMVAPYTPLIGDIGIRVAIKWIGYKEGLIEEKPPELVLTPNLPMITREPMVIQGIHTLAPDQWDYAYGPKPE